MMNILYVIANKLYINLTNKCPCDCIFCIRNNGDGAYGSDSLWLDRDPDENEVIDALKNEELDKYDEIIYCGFGEPTEAIELLVSSARYIKSVSKTPIRLNTNGLSDLINGKPTAKLLDGLVDTISISLNAGSRSEYQRVTQPCFGKDSFDAMLKFAGECREFAPKVMFTVVDVISSEEISNAQKLADEMGIELRVRKYDD